MCSLRRLHEIVLRSALASGFVLVCAVCWAGTYSDLKQKLSSAKTDDEVISLVRSSAAARNPDIKSALDARDAQGVDDTQTAQNLRAMVDLGSMAERPDPSTTVEQSEASAIKQSPFYRDPGIDQKRNWLGDALERIKNIHWNFDRAEQRQTSGASLDFGDLPKILMWTLIIGGICTLLFFAAKHINWQRTLTRRAKAVLEDDEPDRTLDEWLQLADHHASEGRYREAVRALYLACLLKFDENDVARFDRGETNWEHLTRIEESPKLPLGVEFRKPTQLFDRIWYGYQTKGMPDVDEFRGWYRNISDSLQGAPA